MTLKIKPEHFEVLKAACEATLAANPTVSLETYKAKGLSAMRFNWDVFNASTIEGKPSCHYLCDVLYKYLDDSHISSALKVILGNDGASTKQVAKKSERGEES